MNLCGRLRHDEHGAAAVEFALILPLFTALLLGMIEFGFVFNEQITLTQAAREGARIMAVQNGNATSDAAAAAAAVSAGDAVARAATTAPSVSAPSVTFNGLAPSAAVGVCFGNAGAEFEVKVTDSYDFQFLPFATRTLQGLVRARCGV